jgi:hypothetical protein
METYVYRTSVENSEAKNPLGRPSCRGENTKIYLKDIRSNDVVYIHESPDRDV